jgi:hypothetical protein
MGHDWTVAESEGRWVGACSCEYAAVGGYEADVNDNMLRHEES